MNNYFVGATTGRPNNTFLKEAKPLKLSSDNETLAENKALILYVLDKINKPISNDALLQLVLSIDNMNYFYFQQFLLDLLENKYIINYNNEFNENVYEITPEGKQTLSLVKDIIPGITKFRVDNEFKDNLEEIENSLSITADFIPHSETDYSVKCKIVENNRTLFEITTFAGSREQAKKIADNWKQNATQIYPDLLDTLTRDYEN